MILRAFSSNHEDFISSKTKIPVTLRLALSCNWQIYSFLFLFLLSGILTLSQYGMTWDEGLGNFFFGERYLYYLTHFDPRYLDFNADPLNLQKTELHLIESPFHAAWHEFPPVADVLSAATMHIVSYRFGWLDPVEAFHLFTILLTTLFLGILYFFAAQRIGRSAAFIAVLMLGTYPRLWTDMHFNVKDVPEMALYGLAIISYFTWYERPRPSRAVLAGLLFGLAIGVKANAVFIPLTLILGLWPVFNPRLWKNFFLKLARQTPHYLLMILTAVMVYFLSWPVLQRNPKTVFEYFDYVISQGGREGGPGWKWRPVGTVLSTMPEVMVLFWLGGLLLIFIYGVVKSGWFRNEEQNSLVGKTKTPLLFLRLLFVWCLLPIIRTSLPGMVNFDGIRHFLEFLPPAALISAWCGTEVILRFGTWKPGLTRTGIGILSGAVVLSGAIAIAQYYPYSYLYFNGFVGGLRGAERIFGQDETTDYWASSYRQGIRWLNANAPPNALLYVPIAGWVVKLPRNLWLRPDISVSIEEEELKSLLPNPNRPIYMMFITRPSFYTELINSCFRDKTPVFQIKTAGKTILDVYRIYPER
jgi:4-amino-4-deoxy-L-arabinose transferase-like glycosyltransferase